MGKETHNDKHNYIKDYMFFVIIHSAIDQGYIGLSLSSCHKDKDEIWDLGAELGLIWDHFRAFGTSLQTLFLLFGFFSFRDQIFRNRDRDFFPRPNFFETETETFFRNQIFRNRNPQRFGKSFETKKFRNRNVNLSFVHQLKYLNRKIKTANSHKNRNRNTIANTNTIKNNRNDLNVFHVSSRHWMTLHQ